MKQAYNKIRLTRTLALALLSAILLSCNAPKETSGKKVRIVTTTGMIRDAAMNVIGGHAEIVSLMGPGVDPHLYKATQGDLEKLTNADIIFYNGLHLEGKMGEVMEKLGRSKPVIAISKDIPDSLLRTVPGFQGTHDPHIWFDVSLWRNATKTILSFMLQYDSAKSETYQANSARYLARLDSLHQKTKERILEIPDMQRALVTAHDAFGYFGDAYGIQVRGLQGVSTVSEFGLRDVTDLVDFIIARKIKAIFVETSVSKKSIEAVVEGCKQKNWEVKIGGSLYSDAMGTEGTPEGTYIGMVNKNVSMIVDALK